MVALSLQAQLTPLRTNLNGRTRPLARAQHFEDVVGEECGHGGAVLVDGLEDLDEDLQRGDGRRALLRLVRDHRRQVLVHVAGILPGKSHKNGQDFPF